MIGISGNREVDFELMIRNPKQVIVETHNLWVKLSEEKKVHTTGRFDFCDSSGDENGKKRRNERAVT